MKKIFILFLLVFANLYSISIGNYKITQKEINAEMEKNKDLSKNEVIQMLTENYTLLTYADNHQVYVFANEIKNFFKVNIKDERLYNNDVFDEQKYQNFLNTSKVKEILPEIKNLIRIQKVKDILKEQMNISLKDVLSEYVFDNFKGDISYFLINEKELNYLKDYSVEEAYNFYAKKSFLYKATQKIKLKYFVVFDGQFDEEENSDKSLSKEEIHEKTKKYIIKLYKNMKKKDQDLKINIFESPYLEENEQLGKIENTDKLIKKLFNEEIGKACLFDFGEGYIVAQVLEKKTFSPLQTNYSQIWNNYIDLLQESKTHFIGEKYFQDNLEKYIGKAYYISYAYKEDKKNFSENDYNNDIVLLNNIKNKNDILDIFAKEINDNYLMNSQNFSFSKDKKNYFASYNIIYKFEDYIPNFEEVKTDIYENHLSLKNDFKELYNKYNHFFKQQRKLKLEGFFFPYEKTKVKNINSKDLNKYIDEMPDKYEYVYIEDKELLNKEIIDKLIKKNMNQDYFKLLNLCYSKELDTELKSKINAKAIEISNELNINEISKPYYCENGWIIVRRLDKYFSYDKDEIKKFAQDKLKKERTKKKAEMLFDSIKNYNNFNELIKQYSDNYFESDTLCIDSIFPVLGSLEKYKKYFNEIIYSKEKFKYIFENDSGCAVIYISANIPPVNKKYKDILPTLENLYKEEYAISKTNNFLNEIITKIKSGVSADSLLTFWGGWKEIKVNKNFNLPYINYGDELLKEIIKKKTGEYSNLIKINNYYLFYKVNSTNIDKLSEIFPKYQRKYEDKLFKQKLKKWIKLYKN